MKIDRALWSSLALVSLVGIARSETLIVDVNAGTCSDFTDLPPAIAAAQDGDTIRILPGSYSAFTLDKELTLIGEGSVSVAPGAIIENIAAGERVTLVNISLTSTFFSPAEIRSCDGVVVLENGSSQTLELLQCADVRLRHQSFSYISTIQVTDLRLFDASGGYTDVTDTRIEIVSSSLTGFRGLDGGTCFNPNGSPGGAAVFASTGAEVHVYDSILNGGDGGDAQDCGGVGQGGIGAAGMRLVDNTGASAFVCSSATVITGGEGGFGFPNAPGGPGIQLGPLNELRLSGATLIAGTGSIPLFDSGGTVTNPVPDDPTLTLSGTPAPGATMTYTINAPVGTVAILRLGPEQALTAVAWAAEDELIVVDETQVLGLVPVDGTLDFPLVLPDPLPANGFERYAQGMVSYPDTTRRNTNSIALTARESVTTNCPVINFSVFCQAGLDAGPCPCGNDSLAPTGCLNTAGVGAILAIESGSASIAAADLELVVTNLPPNFGQAGIFFTVDSAANIVPGLVTSDGLLCVGGGPRLQVGLSVAPGVYSTTNSLNPVNILTEGGGFYFPNTDFSFQYFYRDQNPNFLGVCNQLDGAANLSNALQITLLP